MNKLTIVFDFDGTLYDSYNGIMLAFNESSIQLFNKGFLLNKNDIGPKLRDLYLRAFEDRNDESFTKFENLFRQNYDNKYYIFGQLYEGVIEFLELNFKLGNDMFIISNKPQKILNKTVSELKISKYFKSIIGSQDFEDGNKTQKLKSIIDNFCLKNCCVFGDTEEDLNMAKFNNCQFIHAKYGYGQINEPCISVNSITELKNKILEK